jgi:hypothetical protein
MAKRAADADSLLKVGRQRACAAQEAAGLNGLGLMVEQIAGWLRNNGKIPIIDAVAYSKRVECFKVLRFALHARVRSRHRVAVMRSDMMHVSMHLAGCRHDCSAEV